MLSGEYECRVDEKFRIAIPKRLREELKDGLVLTRGVDKCMVVYSPAEWNIVTQQHRYSPFSPSKQRMLSRLMYSNCYELTPDGQGRIPLPAPLREHAQVKDTVVIVGQNTFAEIWSKDLWETQKALIDEQAWQLAEGIEIR